MSTYFGTGATGFIGWRPVERLLRRPSCERAFALVRPQSADQLGKHDKRRFGHIVNISGMAGVTRPVLRATR